MSATCTMRTVTNESVLSPAPGAEQYLALDFVNSGYALANGNFVDLLGNRSDLHHVLVPPHVECLIVDNLSGSLQ